MYMDMTNTTTTTKQTADKMIADLRALRELLTSPTARAQITQQIMDWTLIAQQAGR